MRKKYVFTLLWFEIQRMTEPQKEDLSLLPSHFLSTDIRI
uniref:Uncharacterized protein n=1 Tax=Anguilla anguilla TaxID=7936 RepID=A0A0E9VZ57_ANGAN